jgi:hypothetical protein
MRFDRQGRYGRRTDLLVDELRTVDRWPNVDYPHALAKKAWG